MTLIEQPAPLALERLGSRSPLAVPLVAVLVYPFLLMLFHAYVSEPSGLDGIGAVIALALAFAVPIPGLLVAGRADVSVGVRRFAYACVAAPTLYVFLGVVQALLGSTLPDPLVWCVLWLGLAALALLSGRQQAAASVTGGLGRWRVAHGVSGAILCLYVLFHLANHLTGLVGPELHAQVMDLGRTVYRAGFIEPLLVLAFVFQVVSGLHLAWRWSARVQDRLRTLQVASGVFLSLFVLGHMNSVFIYARTYLGIPTEWNFATGAPTGLLFDPWNIRLVPHYTLGVFLVLVHLLLGLRVVMQAHGVRERTVRLIWRSGLLACAAIALAIIAGMCGVRL
ncbi:hypothetical protein [Pseudomonas sp. MNR3A]|uniref:hypothetical protein n=1 Tax=Pseudomonas sp. MNR3A TaxID=2615213 RepID=UPI001C498512|nr:hypothetical protein [Pseudomonas sp. MNR3A]